MPCLTWVYNLTFPTNPFPNPGQVDGKGGFSAGQPIEYPRVVLHGRGWVELTPFGYLKGEEFKDCTLLQLWLASFKELFCPHLELQSTQSLTHAMCFADL